MLEWHKAFLISQEKLIHWDSCTFKKGWCGAVVTEAVVRKCSVIKVLLKFRNIHKKTFVLESLFNKGPLGLQLY